jgi:hypothetical protein
VGYTRPSEAERKVAGSERSRGAKGARSGPLFAQLGVVLLRVGLGRGGSRAHGAVLLKEPWLVKKAAPGWTRPMKLTRGWHRSQWGIAPDENTDIICLSTESTQASDNAISSPLQQMASFIWADSQ